MTNHIYFFERDLQFINEDEIDPFLIKEINIIFLFIYLFFYIENHLMKQQTIKENIFFKTQCHPPINKINTKKINLKDRFKDCFTFTLAIKENKSIWEDKLLEKGYRKEKMSPKKIKDLCNLLKSRDALYVKKRLAFTPNIKKTKMDLEQSKLQKGNIPSRNSNCSSINSIYFYKTITISKLNTDIPKKNESNLLIQSSIPSIDTSPTKGDDYENISFSQEPKIKILLKNKPTKYFNDSMKMNTQLDFFRSSKFAPYKKRSNGQDNPKINSKINLIEKTKSKLNKKEENNNKERELFLESNKVLSRIISFENRRLKILNEIFKKNKVPSKKISKKFRI